MPAAKGKYGGRKVREGTVVSDKMQKTVLVAVEEHVKHRLYKKRVKRVHKFMAHDEQETAKQGDRVRIIESRPVSKIKRWALVEVLQRVELPEVAPESIDLDLLGEVKPVPSEVEGPAAEAETPAVTEAEAAAPAEEPAAAEPAAAEPEAEAVVTEEVVVEEAAEPEAEIAPEAAAEPLAEEPVAEEPAPEPEPAVEAEEVAAEAPADEAAEAEEAPAGEDAEAAPDAGEEEETK